MRPDDIKAGIFKWRALLIIGALVSLCVSDGVGPRLMPLPVPEITAASDGEPRGADIEASRAPAPSKDSSRWVVMAAVGQNNRAGARHERAQSATHAPQRAFEAPAGIVLVIVDARGPLFPITPRAARPPGRAPPRLV